MSIVNMSVLTGIQVPLAGFASNVMTGGTPRELESHELVGSGFIAVILAGLACGPMELVMIQQQRFGGSLVSAAA